MSPDDPATCGSCTNDCNAEAGANAAAACIGGQCSYMCQPGYLNCAPGSAPKDGCGVNVAQDLSNCGACNHACTTDLVTANAPNCKDGVCTITCHPDRLNCNNSPEDGCETPQSPTNCNACGAACHPAGSDQVASPTCVAQPNGSYACAPQCNAGFGNCNGLDWDGCEVNLKTDVNNCGTCSKVCTTTGGAAVGCTNGFCRITACPPGRLDCNGNPVDGCEKPDNPCGCGCDPNSVCTSSGCEPCQRCGSVACCIDSCQYCPKSLRVECGPCPDFGL